MAQQATTQRIDTSAIIAQRLALVADRQGVLRSEDTQPAAPGTRNEGLVKLTIDKEFRILIPPLQGDELAQLEQHIKDNGCRDALVTWKSEGKEILIDGHNRYEICTRNGIPFKLEPMEFANREWAALWIRENQMGRRNLTDGQRAIILDEIAEQRAKLNVSERNRDAALRKHGVRGGEPRPHAERCRAAIARENRITEHKLRTARQVRKADPVLAERVRNGEIELVEAQREVRKRKMVADLENLEVMEAKVLEGKFDVVVCDPPWPMQFFQRASGGGGGLGNMPTGVTSGYSQVAQYPTMSLPAIETLLGDTIEKHASRKCHLFLWTTQKFLPEALRMLESLSLDYVCTFVWHKNGGAQWLNLPQYNCEFIMYARKGKAQFYDTKSFFTCFDAKRGNHSEKPEAFYETIERVTRGRRLDMFSRRKIDGFEGWGKETAAG